MHKELEIALKNLEINDNGDGIKENIKDNFDPKIFELIIVLNALGLNTSGSYQGHPEQDCFDFLPKIVFVEKSFYNLYDKYGIIKANTSKKTLILEHLKCQKNSKKLQIFLNEFYEDRSTPMRHRLIVIEDSFYGTLLESNLEWMHHIIKDKKERIRLNKIALDEVKAFTEFLSTKL